MDAITLLRNDHKTVEGLFKKFEKAGSDAHKTQLDVVEKIIEELSVHASIEEQVFYPAIREQVPDTETDVLESLEEHHVVKWTLSELEDMKGDEERFEAKVTVLIESVEHHAREEEEDLFPEVRKAMGRKALADLGAAMERAKKKAPTRPHPRAPDTPPGNVAAAKVTGLADKARTVGKRTVESAVRQ